MVPFYDLVIIGYGIVGNIAALLATHYKLRVAVMELRKFDDLFVSKAGRIDAEVMRIFDHLGLREELEAILNPLQGTQVVDKSGRTLFELKHPEMEGCAPMYGFYQPVLQQILQQKLKERGAGFLTLYEGHKAEAIEQREHGVQIFVSNIKNDEIFEIKTRFIMACNGQESLVPAQCELSYRYFGYSNYTLNVDTLTNSPITSPHFARTICDAAYPVTCITDSAHHQRWEFQLNPDTLAETDMPTRVRQLMEELISEPFELQSTFVYAYEAKMLDKWQRQRVFITGEAAHVIPPYLGLGLSAGIKDVYNLVWKIAKVADRKLSGQVLDYYQGERESNVRHLLQLNLAVKQLFNSGWLRFARRFLPLVPRQLLRRTLDLKTVVRYGLVGAQHPLRGTFIIRPKLQFFARGEQFIDEALGDGFALLALNENPVDVVSPDELEYLAHIGTQFIKVISKKNKFLPETRYTELIYDANGQFETWCLQHRIKYVFLRPDRIIFDAARNAQQLHKQLKLLKAKLPLRNPLKS